ncbi:MAG TPA: AAA family ATPase [bacterium]|nr:AAA family ATPase [bacterium]
MASLARRTDMSPEPRRAPAAEPPPIDWLDDAAVGRVRTALAGRDSYQDQGGPIELVQTHISSVFLTPRYVFKFKRPLDVGFADFRTVAQRERFCRAELELNRRLAKGVYLDVLPLHAAGEGFRLGGSGEVADWCVVMTRLPAADMLDHRLSHGRVSLAQLDALAELLVAFHRNAVGGPGLARFGGLDVVRGNWDENFAQTEAFVGQTLSREDFDAIRAAVGDWLARHAALLEARAAGGFVRDGHGDLRCEHVYLGLGEAIKVIDCVEFNDRFRYGDVANDLAFLLMDLTNLGQPRLARRLLERYVALSGDAGLPRLVAFYACYRAYVRGKVTAFKLNDRTLAGRQREAVRKRAAGYFRLARNFTRQMAPPVLVLVAGLMGTGKTALAEALAAEAGLVAHNSDAVRKALAAAESASGAAAPWGGGIYTPAWNARTYDALFARAEAALRAGRSVILDASFSRRADRQCARELATRLDAQLVLVECKLDEARTRKRLRQRTREGRSVSDGREALYERQRAAFEPVEELPAEAHHVVVTEGPPRALATELLPRLALPPPLFGVRD